MRLDLAGPELDTQTPELSAYASFRDVAPFAGLSVRPYPAEHRAVVQRNGDGIEDGHETAFQTAGAKYQYRCFLKTFASGSARIVAPQDTLDSCP
jgi:hypothetical protein